MNFNNFEISVYEAAPALLYVVHVLGCLCAKLRRPLSHPHVSIADSCWDSLLFSVFTLSTDENVQRRPFR